MRPQPGQRPRFQRHLKSSAQTHEPSKKKATLALGKGDEIFDTYNTPPPQ
jgi:hypothetical protein